MSDFDHGHGPLRMFLALLYLRGGQAATPAQR